MKRNLSEIKGFENCNKYVIYDNGKLFSLKINKFLKGSIDSKGYLYYDLRSENAIYKCPKAHRLVMMAFSKDMKKEQINHKNGIKTDNRIENLEWCTNRENRIHAIKDKLKNEINYGILQYDLNGNFIKKYDTCKQAMEELNIKSKNYGNIGRAVRGKRKTAYGYIWKQC